MTKDNWVLAAVVALSALVATSAAAIEPLQDQVESEWCHEIRVGVLAHDVDGLWSSSRSEGGVDFNAEIIFHRPTFSLRWGTVYPNLGLSVNSQGGTSGFYVGLLWEFEMKYELFISLGIGVTVHNGELGISEKDKKGLGSRVLFRIPVELGYALNNRHRVSIGFAHMSNASLAYPNEGLDTLGLRYGYRF